MKRYLLVLLLVILVPVIITIGLFAKQHWLYRENVIANICIQQKLMTSDYDLVSCSGNEIYVSNINGWIIEKNLIYGVLSNPHKYFVLGIYDSDKSTLVLYGSMSKLNSYLKTQGISSYNMSKEENLSHLKFGNGRNRKY
jgi:hypothetical protein